MIYKGFSQWLRNSLKQSTLVDGLLHAEFFKSLKTNFILLKFFSNELTNKKKRSHSLLKFIDDIQLGRNANNRDRVL